MSIIPVFSGLIFLGVSIWCFARILIKAGRSPWWSLTMILFPINLILIWVFAYSRWPIIDEFGRQRVQKNSSPEDEAA